MPPSPTRAAALAQRLLDAQVAFHLERLTGDRLVPTVTVLVDRALASGARLPIEELVDRDAVVGAVVRTLRTTSSSAAVAGIVEAVVDVLMEGPDEPYPLGDLADRPQVEALVDSLLAFHPVVERFVDGLAGVPLVGTTASRFMGRVAAEVLRANKAVADKVPGLGSLMSLGTNAATRMVGSADKRLDGLIGDTMGKGGALAVRRLNRVVVETLRDPVTREAVLQAWDQLAEEDVTGLREHATREQVAGVADALHDLAIRALATDHADALVGSLVDAFVDRFGGYTPTELLDELDLTRDDLVTDVVALAAPLVEALRTSGELDSLLRAELEPFFGSPEVTDLLG
ncbi:MAG: hypothetical protein KDB63_13305 [Nocardioidaceae bacterium]|nr:hypothetical protein [Nocardioidaceae bacterium]